MTVILRRRGQERRYRDPDFPVAIGGDGADIEIDGLAAGPVAWLGLAPEGLFIEPVADAGAVECNGEPLRRSQWLVHDDVVRIAGTRMTVTVDGDTIRLTVEPKASALPGADTAGPGSHGSRGAPPAVAIAARADRDQTTGPPAAIAPASFTPRTRLGGHRSRRLRPRVVLPWVAAVLLAGGGWFLFSLRSVAIAIEPAPQHLSLEGGVAWQIAGRHLVRPGVYHLRAEAAGYHRLDTAITVTEAPSQSFELVMHKLPGLLVVDVDGAEGVAVRVDGADVGTTPLAPMELAAGAHDVRFASRRYDADSARVSLAGGGQAETLRVRLVPRWASIGFTTSPPGATVRVDGAERGVTPVRLELLAGRHAYELRADGRQAVRGVLEVVARHPRDLPRFALPPAAARLVLTSAPPGATVTVDGDFRGQTPVVLALDPTMTHRIVLERSGYAAVTHAAQVAPGRTDSLNVDLQRLMGEVRFDLSPPDAQLVIDGAPRAASDRVLRLPVQALSFQVRKPGYQTYTGTVTPRPGLAQTVQVRLRTEAEVQAEKTPPRITTSQGQDLVLIHGGHLRLGAPRREPGRRSNEARRDVELVRPYYLGVTEVSNRQFRAFASAHQSGAVGEVNLEVDHHPVVRVTWQEAARYCNWLSAQESLPPAYRISGQSVAAVQPLTTGYRLPTEAEWAWAARYEAHEGAGAKYPWGQGLPIPPRSGNWADASAREALPAVLPGYVDGYAGTAPVDGFLMNTLGIYNLGGNVAEWVHDVYTVYPSGAAKTATDPTGASHGALHTIRGASWMDAMITRLRLSYRDYGSAPRPDVGFRLARYAE